MLHSARAWCTDLAEVAVGQLCFRQLGLVELRRCEAAAAAKSLGHRSANMVSNSGEAKMRQVAKIFQHHQPNPETPSGRLKVAILQVLGFAAWTGGDQPQDRGRGRSGHLRSIGCSLVTQCVVECCGLA